MKHCVPYRIALLPFLHLPFSVSAQTNSDTASYNSLAFQTHVEPTQKLTKLLVGVNFQGSSKTGQEHINRKLLELGIHRVLRTTDPVHPAPVVAYGVSTEFELRPHPITGFKASAWVSVWFLEAGLNTIYYTDFSKGNFKIRPELGIGAAPFKLTIGYNIPTIANKSLEQMRHADLQVSLAVLLTMYKAQAAIRD